jgi:hypothetical protein
VTIGSDQLDVIGIDSDGRERALMQGGEWQQSA